ncbi:MAG: integrase arm-type DNA-binding domain-containing protein [Qipengyuania sp.]|nr:integrase arm-type DNA-binding domain-containing protein [Qipengyuania sp.]
MLTDTAIRSLKSETKPYKKGDGGGLHLLVTPGGAKLWRWAYRFDGKQKTLAGGTYPATGLAAAREWRNDSKALVERGRDPGEVKKAAKREARSASANTFESIAREWLASIRPHWSDRYAALVLGRFENDVFPKIGKLPIASVDGPALRAMLKTVEDRGAVEFAHRIRAHCGNVFRFAIAGGRARHDPSVAMADAQPRPKPVVHRPRVGIHGMPDFFARFARDEGHELTHLALRWTILTIVRTQETRFALKDEIQGLSGPAPQWRISAERMKMRNEHVVPLSRQAAALLPRIFELSPDSNYLFPMPGTKKGVISENRMLDCMYRMGYRGKATVHGFRGLASTVLNEQTRIDDRGEIVRMWDSDWVERQLAHVEQDEVRGAYNAAEWIGPRRRMLQWWADWLEEQERAASRLAGATMVEPAHSRLRLAS